MSTEPTAARSKRYKATTLSPTAQGAFGSKLSKDLRGIVPSSELRSIAPYLNRVNMSRDEVPFGQTTYRMDNTVETIHEVDGTFGTIATAEARTFSVEKSHRS